MVLKPKLIGHTCVNLSMVSQKSRAKTPAFDRSNLGWKDLFTLFTRHLLALTVVLNGSKVVAVVQIRYL